MSEPDLIVAAATVTVDAKARTITGLIVPFGIQGSTNAGKTLINAGALSWSDQPRRVKLLREHQTADSVGWASEIAETPAGITATFTVPEGDNGDRALAEADNGIRDGLSVGIYDLQGSYDKDKTYTVNKATLREVSLVSLPAFDDARVSKVSATLNESKKMEDTNVAGTETRSDDLDSIKAELNEIKSLVTAKATDNRIKANVFGPNGADTNGPEELTLERLTAMAADAKNDRSGSAMSALTAALSDVVPADAVNTFRPVYVDELVQGASYTRRFINNACTVKPLPAQGNSFVYYQWDEKPEVQDYAGNKANVPSNEVSISEKTAAVSRVAGAWDVDRIFWDRGESGFISQFLEAQTESYMKKTNGKALAAAIAGATVLDSDTGTGGNQAYANLMAGITAGAVQLATAGESVDYVAVSADLYSYWLTITNNAAPAFFSGAFDLTGSNAGGTFGGLPIFVESGLPAKTFLMGKKEAVRFHEQTPPIRVQVVNVAQGGIDLGVFGYVSAYVYKPAVLLKGTVS